MALAQACLAGPRTSAVVGPASSDAFLNLNASQNLNAEPIYNHLVGRGLLSSTTSSTTAGPPLAVAAGNSTNKVSPQSSSGRQPLG